ncbi:MAG: hypothetical protein LLG00_14390 [Planctomycetaceae bacterium]|nr:hypothetical protein [Planctomycetaceae bacterium]
MEQPHLILGVHVTNRADQAPTVQELLTQYGCSIKTRIGLHHVDNELCSPRGLILLEMFGDLGACRELKAKLAALKGVDVQEMLFEHD